MLLAAGLPAYGLLVGWGTAVCRSAGAGSLWCLLRAAGRRATARALLLLLLAAALWSRPASWREAGLQLSYLVAAALIGMARAARGRPPRRKRVGWLRGAPRLIFGLLAAQATAWPLILAHFGWGSPLFLVTNLILVPLVGLLPAVLLPCLLLGQIPGFPNDVAFAPAQVAAQGLVGLSGYLARLCDGWIVGGALTPPLALAAAALAASCCTWGSSRAAGRAALALLTGAAATLLACSPGPSPTLLMLDVGQGESWLLVWQRETWLIDAGPPPGTGGRPRRCLEGALRYYGRGRIDRLFLTHDDLDHTGGLAELGGPWPAVGTIYHPRGWRPTEPTRRWLETRAAQGARICGLARGDRLLGGQAELRVLHPEAPASRYPDRNSASLALLVAAEGLRLLIAGDVPGRVERTWLGDPHALAADVVSAAHHGSGGSTPDAFLEACGAGALLVSAGRHNRFGHPAPRILEAASRFGIGVYRTDQDGTIVIEYHHGDWAIRSWTGAGCPPMTIGPPLSDADPPMGVP
jgi:competence protein ComEC